MRRILFFTLFLWAMASRVLSVETVERKVASAPVNLKAKMVVR